MPLLNKKPFEPNELPEDLSDEDEVFHCELTNEIFRDYEDFCKRIILCNSLVWACSLSGRANLTYQEAIESEESAKSMLNDFPMELRIPVLFLTTLTHRRSLNELAEDVYCFAKDRYFIGESVEVEFSKTTLTTCRILRAVEPSEEQLSSFKKQTPLKNGERQYWPPASLYRYVVQPVDTEKYKSPKEVSADDIHRKKSCYSRAKNRLYIKQFTEQENGVWRLKSATAEKFNISNVQFNLIFAGDAPDLNPNKKSPSMSQSKSSSGGKKKQGTIDSYFSKRSPSKQNSGEHSDAQQKSMLQKLKDKYKAQNTSPNKNDPFRQKRKYTKRNLLQSSDKNSVLSEMELKEKKKEEKQRVRDLKRKKKEQLTQLMKEYNRKRDDLELEDLQDLPEPLPIELGKLPNELFGEFAMAMEFLHTFRETIKLKDYFPNGITIDILERALVEREVAGPFFDILEMLLLAIFELQEDEDDEIEDSDLKSADWHEIDVAGDDETKEAVKQATIAARWSQVYHRTPLNKMTLDASTVTEVLRLHLLASGGRCGESSSKWRYQQRGGYSSLDDPGLMLRLTHPHILEALNSMPFCDLPIGDKLAVLSCLMNQILTFSAIRDVIDERMEKIKQAKVDMRTLNGNDRRREQEALQKVKDGEWTAEQLEKEKELLYRRKQDQGRRLRELNEENMLNQVLPLGADRAYRRFWVFTSIPGLFVENDERNAGICLPKGTPALDLGMVNGEDPELYVKRLFTHSSNKENLLTTPSKTQLTPSKKTPIKTPVKTPSKKSQTPNKNAVKEEEPQRRPLTCWADSTLCPVHAEQVQKTCWSFYNTEADVDTLISNLNKRGLREHILQAALEEERDRIVQTIGKCPMSRLNPQLCPLDETRKSLRNNPKYENANLNFPPGTPSDEILESVLRDLILETEEKINNGCLGSLKVSNRAAWREAILNNKYDQQCDRLAYGGSTKTNGEMNGDMEDDSRPSTPSSEASFRDFQLNTNTEQSSRIRDLASAILQLEQSIDPKYLKRPLGRGTDKKDVVEKENKAALVARERWETSLMTSTSISQLFLHVSTLDSSIMWARSILKAYCRLCKRKGDPEKMLLCDGCNKGHHMYCLKPKLNNVPRGEWFCPKCKPREKPSPAKKQRRIFSAESDDEGEEKENESEEKTLPLGQCKVCRAKGPVIACEQCDDGYHFSCVQPPLRKVPSGNWYCQKCRKGAAQAAKKEETSPSSDVERSSRRRSSKAATAKISQFAKQLRTNNWDGDSDGGSANGMEKREGSLRRSRRSLEAELAVAREQAAVSKDLPLDNAALQEILDQLMHHEAAWPFLRPVTKADVADYHTIIKHPMDFGTIKHKLNMLEYRTNEEVLSDSMLVFNNCFCYNSEDSEIYKCGLRLQEMLEKLCGDRGLHIHIPSNEDAPPTKRSRLAL